MIVLIAAAVIWLALVATRRRVPMLIASAILVGAWLCHPERESRELGLGRRYEARALSPARPGPSTHARDDSRSCASLEAGMTLDAVKKHLGAPDETRADEETRGPGATMLIYRNSRCAVHLLDDRVEFID
jgi:hypothetical protein